MRVIIFGLEPLSSLACYLLTHDSPHEVTGFTVNAAWLRTQTFNDKPVVPFENLEERFPPADHALLIPLGWTQCNKLRAARYVESKARGYSFVTYISSSATVWPDLQIGENCMVYERALVRPFARIGNNCMLGAGTVISHHSTIGDHVYTGAHAVVAGATTVGERCVLGVNSTVIDGIAVGAGCFVAAGAVVAADTEPDGM
ncbi:MAG: acetyltransferase, partial [Pseudomonadota bacterium]